VRTLVASQIEEAVATLATRAAWHLGEDVVAALQNARQTEASPVGQHILDCILENARVARDERLPLCQDTGSAVVWVKLGQAVEITGGGLNEAVQAGVRIAYALLRKSIVRDPLDRVNTGDNTPAVVIVELVSGDTLEIDFLAKGGGCENCSRAAVLAPVEGRDGVIEFVVDTIRRAGGKPCPPIIVGVGIGGTFDQVALLAKQALLRKVGAPNPDPDHAALEAELLSRLNATGIGPMGLGGTRTALAVHVEAFPCHLASLPVAVNVECHSHRHECISL